MRPSGQAARADSRMAICYTKPPLGFIEGFAPGARA